MDALRSHELTELLVAWSDGDAAALDRLARSCRQNCVVSPVTT